MMMLSNGQTKADNYRIATERKKKRSEKPTIFIEAGAHGREWISSASSLWTIDKLLKMIGSNETSSEALLAVDWHIMAMLNPDGFEFSHQFDRMWHKTQSLYNEKPT
jgi:murein tripeptide amidase MpaA